jgi:DNA-directed RNA polymerase specialized sigma24 family protein
MNIDKQRMEHVYLNRDKDPHAQKELIDYFFQIAQYHARRLKVDYKVREDYIQEAVSTAYKNLDKYDPNRKSAAFSYFYKAIYMAIIYNLRKDNNKRKRGPAFSSFDLIEPTIDDESSEILMDEEKTEPIVEVNGKIMNRADMIRAVKEARKQYKKYKKSEDMNTIPTDPNVRYFFNYIKDHEEDKTEA